jgi:hypothetical protein
MVSPRSTSHGKSLNKGEGKPSWPESFHWLTLVKNAPQVHSRFPQNFVALHGTGVSRFIEWVWCAACSYIVQKGRPICSLRAQPHTPGRSCNTSKFWGNWEWACGAIAIAFSDRGFLSASLSLFCERQHLH